MKRGLDTVFKQYLQEELTDQKLYEWAKSYNADVSEDQRIKIPAEAEALYGKPKAPAEPRVAHRTGKNAPKKSVA